MYFHSTNKMDGWNSAKLHTHSFKLKWFLVHLLTCNIVLCITGSYLNVYANEFSAIMATVLYVKMHAYEFYNV